MKNIVFKSDNNLYDNLELKRYERKESNFYVNDSVVSQDNRYGYVKLMCEECFNLYEIKVIHKVQTTVDYCDKFARNSNITPINDLFYMMDSCTYCKKESLLIELDYNIADIISILNKKGYTTKFCCESHNDCNNGYIYFKSKHILNYDFAFPLGWWVDLDDLKENKCIIRCNFSNKEENLKEMYEFVNCLPEVPKIKYVNLKIKRR